MELLITVVFFHTFIQGKNAPDGIMVLHTWLKAMKVRKSGVFINWFISLYNSGQAEIARAKQGEMQHMSMKPLCLWYKKPAEAWEEALPLGNGRLGMMVFGRFLTERLQLNEDSVWYGGPADRNNPDALKYLPEIRRLIFAGEIHKSGKTGPADAGGNTGKPATLSTPGRFMAPF